MAVPLDPAAHGREERGALKPRRRPSALLPTVHSIIAPSALLVFATDAYGLGQPLDCRLLQRWLNDTYLVRTAEDRWILRVYRAGWRTREEIDWELDVLAHLAGKGVAIAAPVPDRTGVLVHELPAPEGIRPCVLFSYAEGREPHFDDGRADAYGAAAARINAALDDFASRHRRFELGLDHLVDAPLASTLPLLAHRPEDADYVRTLSGRLKAAITGLAGRGLRRGVCFGDYHGGNAHVDAAGRYTFFDFDCAGPGWSAYDLAVFRWGTRDHARAGELWASFLDGYRAVRAIPALDLEAVPVFAAARELWFDGLVAGNAELGSGWMDDRYFDRQLVRLREWTDGVA